MLQYFPAIICFLIAGKKFEEHMWNNGVCKSNGVKWEFSHKDWMLGECYKAEEKSLYISKQSVEKLREKTIKQTNEKL